MPSAATVNQPVHFAIPLDIPVQPLADALEQFGVRTGLPVIFDAALMDGRRSTAVLGEQRPMQALQTMLAGTGLVAQYARPGRTDAVVVLPAPREPELAQAPVAAPAGLVHRRYDGLVQTRIRETFCARPLLARGAWRAAVQFHIDAAGHVREARLLDSSGDRNRDAAITEALAGLHLDWAPPSTMAQPVTLLIQPRGASLCANAH